MHRCVENLEPPGATAASHVTTMGFSVESGQHQYLTLEMEMGWYFYIFTLLCTFMHLFQSVSVYLLTVNLVLGLAPVQTPEHRDVADPVPVCVPVHHTGAGWG